MAIKRMVLFDQACSPYLAGEAAAFSEEEAARLIGRGIAHFVVAGEEEGTWVPDEEGIWEDDTPEQTTGDEPAPVATAEGAEEEAEEDDVEEDAEDTGEDDESGAKTKAAGKRRRRAKL